MKMNRLVHLALAALLTAAPVVSTHAAQDVQTQEQNKTDDNAHWFTKTVEKAKTFFTTYAKQTAAAAATITAGMLVYWKFVYNAPKNVAYRQAVAEAKVCYDLAKKAAEKAYEKEMFSINTASAGQDGITIGQLDDYDRNNSAPAGKQIKLKPAAAKRLAKGAEEAKSTALKAAEKTYEFDLEVAKAARKGEARPTPAAPKADSNSSSSSGQ